MRFGKGHLRDTRRDQRDARHLLGGAIVRVPAPGTVVSLRQYDPPVFNQLFSSGCGGHSGASSIYADVYASTGTPMPWVPSPDDLYGGGRCVDLLVAGTPSAPLQDNGTQLSSIATWASDWGIRRMGPVNAQGFTDVDAATIDEKPDLMALMKDSHTLVVDEYRLDLTAPDVIATLCSLCDAKVSVQLGGPVGPAFEGYTLGQPAVPAEPGGAGHATKLDGYWVNPDGTVDFDILSSWSTAFGDQGRARVSSAWARSQWDGLIWRCRLVTS